jgi:hypothetical protein
LESLSKENSENARKLAETASAVEASESYNKLQLKKIQSDLTSAVCLNEKQNALAITLEAKVIHS